MTPVDAFYFMLIILGVVIGFLFYVITTTATHKEADE